MSTKTEYKPRNIKIYDLDEFEKLLNGVKVAACMLTECPQEPVDEESVIKRLNTLTLGGPSKVDQCSCCGAGPFTSRAQQTAHYKHHWHTYNLKRKLFGRTPLTLQQFNSRKDDNSSVSGSDSETEDTGGSTTGDLFAAATRHCKAFFTNAAGQVFCIYRCVLHHRKEDLSTDGNGAQWVERCRELAPRGARRCAILMVSGGHFAAAIFSGSVPVLHKTLHSYLVRRGQGQAQGTRDQHGNAPKSAGASLRRYNQAQFIQHVQDILTSWTDDLQGCSLILYRAVGPLNQGALFGKGSPVSRDDVRVRQLPFPTRKPTFKEVQRAFSTLVSVDVYDTMELFQKALITATARPAARPGSDGSGSDRSRKPAKVAPKLDRAKSREPVSRELPTQVTSSEDEGPCFIDSETPADWIKTLSEQVSTGVITNSRKDLLNDNSVGSPESSDSEMVVEGRKEVKKKKKKKEDKKEEKKEEKKEVKKKIPQSIKKLWQAINDNSSQSLDTILERWEESEADIVSACNMADPKDGNTALHKASIAAKPGMVTELLSAGSDPCARNHQQQTPYAATAHHDTRVAFRLFQADHPDKYNYAKSHIPGPVTPESLEEEKLKKAAQKKAKRQRDKEKQVEKIKTNKFLQLTDDQKLKDGDARCFLCGVSLPKVPFTYDKFRFCTIKCLQNHRNVRPLNMPA